MIWPNMSIKKSWQKPIENSYDAINQMRLLGKWLESTSDRWDDKTPSQSRFVLDIELFRYRLNAIQKIGLSKPCQCAVCKSQCSGCDG